MLNFEMYFWHKYKTTNNNKEKKKGRDLIEKIIIYRLRHVKAI